LVTHPKDYISKASSPEEDQYERKERSALMNVFSQNHFLILIDQVCGWKSVSSIGNSYGKGYSIRKIKKFIEGIRLQDTNAEGDQQNT